MAVIIVKNTRFLMTVRWHGVAMCGDPGSHV